MIFIDDVAYKILKIPDQSVIYCCIHKSAYVRVLVTYSNHKILSGLGLRFMSMGGSPGIFAITLFLWNFDT